MVGPLLSLGSSIFFGFNNTMNRRVLFRVKSQYVANYSIFTGVPFFLLATVITGDLFRLGQYSWNTYLLFAIAGLIHFAFGRTWAYKSLQLIGATRSGVVTSMNFAVTIILALIIFGEAVSPLAGVGIFLAMFGPVVISVKEASKQGKILNSKIQVDRRTLYKGIIFGAGAALMWGSSAIFVKLGTDGGGPPVLGSLVSYTAAALAISPSAFLEPENRKITLRTPWNTARLALYSGLISNVAQLLRYLSLAFGPLIMVSVMLRTSPVFTVMFAFSFNRQYESFSRWVLIGNGVTLIGTALAVFS